MSSNVIYKIESNIAHITINRPEARNALNADLIKNLINAFKTAATDSNVNVILITGAGDRAFCAGADLSEVAGLGDLNERRDFFSHYSRLLKTIVYCTKPVVGMVYGYALAGGCGIAAACDIVFASNDSKFGLPEVNIGIVPMVALIPMMNTMPKRVVMHMALSGEPISAEGALQSGLINFIFDKVELESKTLDYCLKLSKKSPLAIKTAKDAVVTCSSLNLEDAFATFPEKIAFASMTRDAKEGITAFLEKRAAVWEGR